MFERGRQFVVSLKRANWTPHPSPQKELLRREIDFHLFRDAHKLIDRITIMPHFVGLPVHKYYGKEAEKLVLNSKDRKEHEEVEKAVWELKELGLNVEADSLRIHPVDEKGRPAVFKKKNGKEEPYHVHAFKVSQGSVSEKDWHEFLKGMHFEFMIKEHGRELGH